MTRTITKQTIIGIILAVVCILSVFTVTAAVGISTASVRQEIRQLSSDYER